MKWIKWAVATGAFLIMLYACALPGDLAVGRDDDGDLPGIYTVNGIDPIGTEYSGTIVIKATDTADRFDVEWIVTGAIQVGIGVRDGDRLVVTWTEVTSATDDGTGPITYAIQADGKLVGTWYADGFDVPGSERVFPEA
ncbi:MAG: hypothetical protein ACR2QK_08475 [Acidimicrobiales bacterium]